MHNKNKTSIENVIREKTFLAIIPARKNSQRVKNKNLFKFKKKTFNLLDNSISQKIKIYF